MTRTHSAFVVKRYRHRRWQSEHIWPSEITLQNISFHVGLMELILLYLPDKIMNYKYKIHVQSNYNVLQLPMAQYMRQLWKLGLIVCGGGFKKRVRECSANRCFTVTLRTAAWFHVQLYNKSYILQDLTELQIRDGSVRSDHARF